MNPAILDRVIEIATSEGLTPPRKQTLRAPLKAFLAATYSTHRDLVTSRRGDAVEYLACMYFERNLADVAAWGALDAIEDGPPVLMPAAPRLVILRAA